jgi:DNA helicase HerA-like ATPase
MLPISKNSSSDFGFLPRMMNRHGLVTGATGTGKTVTLQVIAERLSREGVPVFAADVKGDLSGVAASGKLSPKLEERLKLLQISDHQFSGSPVVFWDVLGNSGHPIRTTISEIGPLLLSRLLNLNETQAGVLQIVFSYADDAGMLILDLKDLKAMLAHVAEQRKELTTEYGNISPASVGAIQRALLSLEEQGGDIFFGEPAFELEDLLQTDSSGRGVINILAADKLIQSPKVYATFLLWMLSELFERLPEVGDIEKPKLVFFFDEAHLLFDDAPSALLEKIEQVVRLIRSKGVGVFFVTQHPLDVPEKVLTQLGNRVQHALRAFTPNEQKKLKSAADTFRANPALDLEKVIQELSIGEAVVSFLDEKGAPQEAQRVWILPPYSQIGPLDTSERAKIIETSPVAGVYENVMDRESAYEMLKKKADSAPQPPPTTRTSTRSATPKPRGDDVMTAVMKSAARAAASQAGRSLIRGILGGLLGGSKRK